MSSWETGSDCSPQMPCNLSWEPPRGSWTWLRERTGGGSEGPRPGAAGPGHRGCASGSATSVTAEVCGC